MTTWRGRLARILLALPLYFVTMVLVHEAGHAVTASYATTGVVRIFVWPGYELYPDLGYAMNEPWPEGTPAVTVLTPVNAILSPDNKLLFKLLHNRDLYELRRHEALVKLMGSAATLLLALVSLCLISLFKPKGIALWLLVAGSLLHLDMLTYTVLPVFFGVRHLYWIGGAVAEPVDALSGLGLPEAFSIAAIILLSLLQCAWLYYLLRVKVRAAAAG